MENDNKNGGRHEYEYEYEYVISFSSFYKAAYAQDELEYHGIRASLRKLPTELVRSCNTGLYLRSASIEQVKETLATKQIVPSGIYRIEREGKSKKRYIKVR